MIQVKINWLNLGEYYMQCMKVWSKLFSTRAFEEQTGDNFDNWHTMNERALKLIFIFTRDLFI